MAKKRKASRQSEPSGPKELDSADARLAIRTYEDIADEQEQYFLDKDKILLEDEPRSKRARTNDRIDEFLEASDEEIMRDDDDSDSDIENEYAELQKAAKAAAKRSRKRAGGDDEEEAEAGEEEGDEGYWGDSRKEYYNADAIETEADALEEETEAKRLQKKKLAEMDEADFIFDEDEWAAPAEEEAKEEGAEVVTEELKDIEVTEDMEPDERYRLLQTRYPEFVPLVEEFESLQPQLAQLQKDAEGKSAKSLEVVKHWLLGCYVAALASYFAVLTSPSRDATAAKVSLSPTELRDHEVMETLVSCREAWHKVRDLKPVSSTADEVELDSAEEDVVVEEDVQRTAKKSKKKAESKDESRKKKKAEKEKLARALAVEESLADLDSLIAKPKVKKVKPTAVSANKDNHSDFGEEDALDSRTAADKAAKKKSLRFYTSQIVQKSSRRATAGRDAGGDVDIPHRERLRDRVARLNAEAERRGKKDSKHGTALGEDGGDSSGDEAVAKQVRGEEDDYYDMIAHRTQAKKENKAARKEALAAASIRDRVVEVETVGEDGKRKINYQIEKNKGLAPKRKKEVRNSRVKKRKKYEEKQKKLKSMKAVYQGGEGRGGYKGETTGIKTGLIKSVKL